ncbi:MAG: hypothetical protein MUE48_02065 [Desulfobacterales bacterium]|nr:hypothetical protein [Desulfobacterales bacterium]
MGPRLSKHAAGLICAAMLMAAWHPATAAPVDVPPGLTVHRDLAYVDGGHERQKLDLYVPTSGEGPFPLIVWIHGGSWTYGSAACRCPGP